MSKALREPFARFFEDPARDKLVELLRDHGGEFRHLEFKEEWPSKGALAKQVLAFGNIGGGIILVGVREEKDGTLTSTGLTALTDKADITQSLKGFLPSQLLEAVSVYDFAYASSDYGPIKGKSFQALFVEPVPDHVPFVAERDGEKITQGSIYVRRDGLVDQANYEEIQKLINQRIEGGHSTQGELDLRQHLEHLKVLYGHVDKYRSSLRGLAGLELSGLHRAFGMNEPNPAYPSEDYEAFIVAQIERKKRLIARLLETDRL